MNHHFRSHTFGGESTLNGDHFQEQHHQLNSTTGAPATRPIDISDGSSNGIIRIHSDSQQSLDRLFNPLASEGTNVVPLRQRNLPSSFFNPRGSSQAIKMEDQHQHQQQPQQQMAHHYRNYSSPVFMANQLVPGQTQAQPNLHHRQGSSSESFGYMTIASSSSSINQAQQPQQHCHQAGTMVQQQQPSHYFNNLHCSSSSNSDQYLHDNNTLHNNNNNNNNNSHHNQHQQIQHSQQQQAYMQPQVQLVQPQQQAYIQPQAQLVQPQQQQQQQPVQPGHPQPQVQQQVVQHYRNYSSPAFMINQVPQNGSLAQAVSQQLQAQAPLPLANLHQRQASSSESFEYVTQTNGVDAGHHQGSQVQTHYNHHAQQQQHHCQQVPDITPQQQPIQFNNQHCSSNLDQNQNYHHQQAQPEPAPLVGSTMLARSFMRRPPYGVSSLGQ